MKKEKKVRITDRSAMGVDLLLKEIRKINLLSKEEEYELWQKMKEGDMTARAKLIKANMRYVVKRAKDFQGSKAALEDLIMAGAEGMVQAVDKFDANLGFRFISFATYYIDNEIRKTANNHMKHNSVVRLDDPLFPDSNSEEIVADSMESDRSYHADWELRTQSALEVMKRGIDKRLYDGAGKLLDDYLSMRERGLTTYDFKRKYRLNESQMDPSEEMKARLVEYMMNDKALMPKTVAIEVRLSNAEKGNSRYEVIIIDEDGQEKEVVFKDRPSRLIYIYTLLHPQGYQRYSLAMNHYRELRQLYCKLYFIDEYTLLKSIGSTEESFKQFVSQAVAQSRVAIRNTGLPCDDIEIGSPKTYGRLLIPFAKNGNTVIIDNSLL